MAVKGSGPTHAEYRGWTESKQFDASRLGGLIALGKKEIPGFDEAEFVKALAESERSTFAPSARPPAPGSTPLNSHAPVPQRDAFSDAIQELKRSTEPDHLARVELHKSFDRIVT